MQHAIWKTMSTDSSGFTGLTVLNGDAKNASVTDLFLEQKARECQVTEETLVNLFPCNKGVWQLILSYATCMHEDVLEMEWRQAFQQCSLYDPLDLTGFTGQQRGMLDVVVKRTQQPYTSPFSDCPVFNTRTLIGGKCVDKTLYPQEHGAVSECTTAQVVDVEETKEKPIQLVSVKSGNDVYVFQAMYPMANRAMSTMTESAVYNLNAWLAECAKMFKNEPQPITPRDQTIAPMIPNAYETARCIRSLIEVLCRRSYNVDLVLLDVLNPVWDSLKIEPLPTFTKHPWPLMHLEFWQNEPLRERWGSRNTVVIFWTLDNSYAPLWTQRIGMAATENRVRNAANCCLDIRS